ncbi:MAG: hypothetical protein IPJ65_19740 [Archangiaceae bacterium]|nr:hypothetical protein [Archangiaceae bacterium]
MRNALFVAVVCGACTAPLEFQCDTTQQCASSGQRGRCESTGYCSFADEGCESGFRYGEWATASLRTRCTDAAACPNGICRGCAVQLEVGQRYSCARLNDGTVECWGANGSSPLGRGNPSSGDASVGRVLASATRPLTGVVDLSAGSYHACAALEGGGALCWGANGNLQLGDGDGGTPARALPAPVIGTGGKPLEGVVDVAAGFDHTCARRANGELSCWGNNSNGALGDRTHVSRAVAAGVLTGAGAPFVASQVSCSLTSSCAITDGGIWCWGGGGYGQLATGNLAEQDHPVQARKGGDPLQGATRLTMGNYSGCATLGAEGVAVCWGENGLGQLGDGTTQMRSTASEVLTAAGGPPLDGVTDVASFDHACAVTRSGEAWCWGENASGELGSGTVGGPGARAPFPTRVVVGASGEPFLGLVQIRTGSAHTCGLRDDGTVWCWGSNSDGQLGAADRSLVSATPRQVALECP